MIRRRFGIRSQIVDPGVTDHRLPYSQQNLSVVLRDWKIISESYDEMVGKVFMKFLYDNPSHRKVFHGFSEVANDNELLSKKVFMDHAYAVMNIIDMALRSLSGEYEDDGELLPVIGHSHKKRGITLGMFNDLKVSLLTACFRHLKSDKKSRSAWTEIINFIFDNYLCIAYKPNK